MFGNKILEERKSKYNGKIVVKKTLGLGTYIQVGGITQSGKLIEHIWKPVIKKISSKKLNIKSILILGLGGGTVVRILKKYFPKSKIVAVEIDSVMVELGKKYLGLSNSDVDIKIADAKKFNFKKYDLVIVDTYLGGKCVDILGNDLLKSKTFLFNRLIHGDKERKIKEFENKLKKFFKNIEIFYPPANVIFFCYN